MIIIQANKAYYPHVGGIETVVQQLAEGFQRRHGCDSRVIVCNTGKHTQYARHNGVPVTYTGTLARAFSLPLSPSFPLHLLREQGDILQLHEPFLLASFTYLRFLKLARKRFKKLVVCWHSDIVRQHAFAKLYTPILRGILREADAVMVATPHHITSSRFLPEFAEKCRVIHFGIDLDRFEDTPDARQRVEAIRARYRKPIVLFIGRLVYYKGAEYLVEAMRSVPEAHLVVVGNGPLKPQLENIAAQGPGNVTFIPFLAEQELTTMYQACDLFVLPSVANTEAYGIVQLEAMACGKPVITTDLPTGVTYVNQDGVTGLVTPQRDAGALASAIRKLVADEALRQKLGQTAAARIRREFTLPQMIDQTVALYRDLLA